MTTRSMYLEELNSLRKSLAEMGAAVEESFNLLLTAVENKDTCLLYTSSAPRRSRMIPLM